MRKINATESDHIYAPLNYSSYRGPDRYQTFNTYNISSPSEHLSCITNGPKHVRESKLTVDLYQIIIIYKKKKEDLAHSLI